MDLSAPPVVVESTEAEISDLYAEGSVIDCHGLFANESVILKAGTSSALGIKRKDRIHQVRNSQAFGVKGRNAEQKFALQLLLDDSVPIVSLGGLAGTGKSVLALAAGIDAVIESRKFKKIVVFRPLFPVGGQELGFLPGDFAEKMDPWAQATWDAIESFCNKNVIDHIVDSEVLEILPLTHLRGRTISDAFIIIDEAQNLDMTTLVTALSRVGEGTKVVLTHDVNQRDNSSVGRADGILAVTERLMGHELFAHITLNKVERSPVARLISELFNDL